MKEKILFFGTLRSKKVLKNVLLENLENFNFKECYIKSAKLKKVVNETYPALFYTNNPLDIVEAVIIEYLEESHLKKILFFESWEYKIENIEVYVDNKKILVKYLKESKKTLISDEDWNYYQWKKKMKVLMLSVPDCG